MSIQKVQLFNTESCDQVGFCLFLFGLGKGPSDTRDWDSVWASMHSIRYGLLTRMYSALYSQLHVYAVESSLNLGLPLLGHLLRTKSPMLNLGTFAPLFLSVYARDFSCCWVTRAHTSSSSGAGSTTPRTFTGVTILRPCNNSAGDFPVVWCGVARYAMSNSKAASFHGFPSFLAICRVCLRTRFHLSTSPFALE